MGIGSARETIPLSTKTRNSRKWKYIAACCHDEPGCCEPDPNWKQSQRKSEICSLTYFNFSLIYTKWFTKPRTQRADFYPAFNCQKNRLEGEVLNIKEIRVRQKSLTINYSGCQYFCILYFFPFPREASTYCQSWITLLALNIDINHNSTCIHYVTQEKRNIVTIIKY